MGKPAFNVYFRVATNASKLNPSKAPKTTDESTTPAKLSPATTDTFFP